MSIFKYYDYMKSYNPVCEDIGEIKTINRNSIISADILADGIRFTCRSRYEFVNDFGILAVFPYSNIPVYNLPEGIKHGDRVEVIAESFYSHNDRDFYNSICIDPRVLYIYHRNYMLGFDPTQKMIDKWRHDIPDRETALKWLNDHGKITDCIPFSWSLKKR